MTGTLRERPFAEIVGSIFQGKQTGELRVTAAGKVITIHFQDGNPVAAASDDPSHRIARILLDNEKIGLGEAEMLGGLPESKQAFETVEYIPPDTLLWGVKFRFLRLLEELFSWEDGQYEFTEGPVPPEALTLRVPTPFVIFTGTAKMPDSAFSVVGDEKRIEEVRPIPSELESFFNPQRKKFLAACRPGQSVGELLSGMTGDRERARHTLYALTALGLVTVAEPPAPPAVPAEPTSLFGDEADSPPGSAPETPTIADAESPPGDEPLPVEAAETMSLEPEALTVPEEEPAPEPVPPPDDEQEEEAPLTLDSEEGPEVEEPAPAVPADTGPQAEIREPAPWDPAPELPLETPAPEAEEKIAGPDESEQITLPLDAEVTPAEESEGGTSLSRSLGLSMERAEDHFSRAEPERPEENKTRHAIPSSSRLRKIAVAGSVLFVIVGGFLLALKMFVKKPAAPPPVPAVEKAVAPPAQPASTDPEAVGGEGGAGPIVPAAAPPPVPGKVNAPGPDAAEGPAEAGFPDAPPPAGQGAGEAVRGAGADAEETLAEEGASVPEATEDVILPQPEALGIGAPEDVLKGGDIDGAARMWVKKLREEPAGTYTLQVLMACEAKSVLESYPLYRGHGPVYVVPFSLKGRACYRIGLGTYPALEAAKNALAGLPSEIRRGGAVVKNLNMFLPGESSRRPAAAGDTAPVPAASPPHETREPSAPEKGATEYGKAREALNAGNLPAAANLWQHMLRQAPPGTYTLQVLTACDPGTVQNYFETFEKYGRVFAVPFQLKGTDCYRLGLETYPSKKAAQAALAAMPQWVRDQRTVVKSVRLFMK